jgi:Zn-dependent protease with chaperone function
MLTAEGLTLIALAVVLAGPAPEALARARWPARSPRAALVLWQAIGLGGGLAILGAGITLAVSGLHRSWLGGLAALPAAALDGGRPGPGPLGWAGLALTLIAAVWLLSVLAVSTIRLLRVRREHRQRIDLLAEEVPAADLVAVRPARPGLEPQPVPGGEPWAQDGRPARDPSGVVASGAAGGAPRSSGGVPDPAAPDRGPEPRVRLVDHPLVAAYCLPGVRPRIVLSQGAIDALSPGQLSAVVSHEHAHARGQHDLVIQPFRAWRQTFPFLRPARRATAAVELLVEMAADDVAWRRCGPELLAAALATLGEPGDEQVTARLARLTTAPRPLPRLAVAAVFAAAVALVCAPPLILLAS